MGAIGAYNNMDNVYAVKGYGYKHIDKKHRISGNIICFGNWVGKRSCYRLTHKKAYKGNQPWQIEDNARGYLKV